MSRLTSTFPASSSRARLLVPAARPHERNRKHPVGPGCVIGGRPLPCRRSWLRGTRQIGFVNRVRDAWRLPAWVISAAAFAAQMRIRTPSAAQLTQDYSIPHIASCRPRVIRAGSRSGSSWTGCAPTFPRLRPRGMANCDSRSRVCRRADCRCSAHPSAAQRLAQNNRHKEICNGSSSPKESLHEHYSDQFPDGGGIQV